VFVPQEPGIVAFTGSRRSDVGEVDLHLIVDALAEKREKGEKKRVARRTLPSC